MNDEVKPLTRHEAAYVAGVRDGALIYRQMVREQVAKLRSIGPSDPQFESATNLLTDLEAHLTDLEEADIERDVHELLLAYRKRQTGNPG